MESYIYIIIVAYYLSIILEIALIPVPSVASTWQLMFPDDGIRNQIERSSLIGKVQDYSHWTKLWAIVIPYILAMLGYAFPLLWLVIGVLSQFDLFPMTFWNILIGTALLVSGRLVTIWSALSIRKDNSQKGEDFDLKTQGIFSRSRNPIVVGLHMGIIGLNILIPNYLFILLTCFYFGNIHFKILIEEDFLRQFFEGDYQSYIKKTKRYL